MWVKLPKTLAYILRERKASRDELRGVLGDGYQDYDLAAQAVGLHDLGRYLHSPAVDGVLHGFTSPTMMVAGCSRIIFFRRSSSSGLRSFTVMDSGGSLSRNFTKPATTGTL